MKYFLNSLNNSFLLKKNDNIVPGFFSMSKPMVGDVLKIYFSKKGSYYFFEGFCFSIFRKNFFSFDTGIRLINKVKGCFIFLNFSFFANLIFNFEKIDFKKIKTNFRRAKVTSFKYINL